MRTNRHPPGNMAVLVNAPRTGLRTLDGVGGWSKGVLTMCDYSLHNVKSRAARVGDKLTSRNFGTGTRGFAASEDADTAVCVLPGTELAFSREVACTSSGFLGLGSRRIKHR